MLNPLTEFKGPSSPSSDVARGSEVTNPGSTRRALAADAPTEDASAQGQAEAEAFERSSSDGDEVLPERIGPYRVLTKIGEGGMGRVVLAHDPNLDRKIALKLLPPADADAEGRARFLREARALARVDHKNVVKVFASGTDDDTAWMALEYVEGDSLSEILDAGVLDELSALELAAQVARGLAAVHEMGIIHRDVKPSNLLLDDEGTVRVLDFGVALLQDVTVGGGFVTQKGIAVGTPHYMAPEQARGDTLDSRVDAWGLGATLFTMLAGHPPFFERDNESDLEILSRVLREPLPDIRTLASVSEETARLVETLLARDAADREDDLEAIADALEDVADAVSSGRSTPAAAVSTAAVLTAAVSTAATHGLATEAADGGLATSGQASSPITKPDGPTALKNDERGVPYAAVAALLLGAVVVLVGIIWATQRENGSVPSAGTPDVVVTPPPQGNRGGPESFAPETAVLDLDGGLDATRVLFDAGPSPDAPPPPLPFEPGALAALGVLDGPQQEPALEALCRQTSDAAMVEMKALLAREDAAGDLAMATVLRVERPGKAELLEHALNHGTHRRQMVAITALEQLRNVAAIEALGRASERHPSKTIRQAALRARRALFSVEGEEDFDATPR